MDLQDFFSSLDIRRTYHNLAVETSGTHQGRIQDIGTVGGGDHNDALVGAEAVHFHQQLVQGLFSFVVASA